MIADIARATIVRNMLIDASERVRKVMGLLTMV